MGQPLFAVKPEVDIPIPEGTNIKPNSPFLPAVGLQLPICLGRISSEGTPRRRITMVLCEQVESKQVYFAESYFRNLEDAIKNLREREGISEHYSSLIGYVDLIDKTNRSRFSLVAERVALWAANNAYDAVIWTDLSAHGITFYPDSTEEEILPYLEQDPVLLANTKKYIQDLPNPPSELYRRILAM